MASADPPKDEIGLVKIPFNEWRVEAKSDLPTSKEEMLEHGSSWIWKVNNFKEIYQDKRTWYRCPGDCRVFGIAWRFRIKMNDATQNPNMTLGISIQRSKAVHSVVLMYSAKTFYQDISATNFATINLKENETGDGRLMCLPFHIDMEFYERMWSHHSNENKRYINHIDLNFCFINETPEDPQQTCLPSFITAKRELPNVHEELFLNPKSADLILKVKDKEFRVQKSWFMVYGAEVDAFNEAEDKGMKSKEIETAEPEEVEDFLRFLYFGFLKDFEPERVFKLYDLSTLFGVRDLQVACIAYITGNMTLHILYKALSFMDLLPIIKGEPWESQFSDRSVILKCASGFIARHVDIILPSEEWRQFEEGNPQLAISVLQTCMNIHYWDTDISYEVSPAG